MLNVISALLLLMGSLTQRRRCPPCVFEDGSGSPLPCRWDAAIVSDNSNGKGDSFTVYPEGTTPDGRRTVRYVYGDGHRESGTI